MSSAWQPADHANAALIRTRLQQGPANRTPPLDTPEKRRRPRIYSLRGAARLEPVAAPFADAPYEGEDEHEDAGIPEVPEDVPGIAALGRWASKAPPPPGPRPPSRSISGVLEARS